MCEWPMMMRGIILRRRQPGFVHMNSLAPGRVTLIFHRIFKFLGYRISSMDQEAGIQRNSYERFARIRYGEETVSAADLIFCWGRDDYETLQRLYPRQSHKIIMSGSPRVDLWRPKFSGIYASTKQELEPFVLIVSSIFGPLLSTGLHERLINSRKSGYQDRDPDIEVQLVGRYKEGADLMLAYLDLIRVLSLSRPELSIVVKSHPKEDVEIWRGIISETARLRVDAETPTSQLVRDSVAVILTGSTVAFEAELAEKPLISFRPFEMPDRDSGFAENLGLEAKSAADVVALLSSILESGRETASNHVPRHSKLDLDRKVYFEDERLAAERMVDSWETVAKTEKPDHGSHSSLSTEELRYLVASAFPFLIPLFSGKRGFFSPSKSKQKRPSIDRKLVRGRVERIQKILGLQDAVAFRFKGRNGLVFEPSRKSNHESKLLK